MNFPVVHNLWVFIPFTHFESEVITTINVAHSPITLNSWAFIRAFKIICRCLEVNPTIKILFYFYGTKLGPKSGWVTICIMSIRILFIPHNNHYKDMKYRFVRVRGRKGVSIVTKEEDSAYIFPLILEEESPGHKWL